MRIAIIGTGYVGTVAGACFADSGHRVICVDREKEKVRRLSMGDPTIYEPGLEAIVVNNLKNGRLAFTHSSDLAIQRSQIIFLTVGTPPREDGSADLSALESAVRDIGGKMREPKIIVVKSTVPIGTQKKVKKWLKEETKVAFEVVSNPEFLREGSAVQDFLCSERVIIGTYRQDTFETMKRLYLPFVKKEETILKMDPISAELTKYAANSFLATKISFINEMAVLCEKTGADIRVVKEGMSLDSRIGAQFLEAGMGYGGSCFPKDIRALLHSGMEYGRTLRIVSAVEEVNREQKTAFLPRIIAHLTNTRGNGPRRVAFWGAAFKANTDDVRESPALVLMDALIKRGVHVAVYDPKAMPSVREVFADKVELGTDAYSVLKGAHALVVATEWSEFKRPNVILMRKLMEEFAIFDGRNLYSPEEMQAAGFRYWSIGRRFQAPVELRKEVTFKQLLPISSSDESVLQSRSKLSQGGG